MRLEIPTYEESFQSIQSILGGFAKIEILALLFYGIVTFVPSFIIMFIFG